MTMRSAPPASAQLAGSPCRRRPPTSRWPRAAPRRSRARASPPVTAALVVVAARAVRLPDQGVERSAMAGERWIVDVDGSSTTSTWNVGQRGAHRNAASAVGSWNARPGRRSSKGRPRDEQRRGAGGRVELGGQDPPRSRNSSTDVRSSVTDALCSYRVRFRNSSGRCRAAEVTCRARRGKRPAGFREIRGGQAIRTGGEHTPTSCRRALCRDVEDAADEAIRTSASHGRRQLPSHGRRGTS